MSHKAFTDGALSWLIAKIKGATIKSITASDGKLTVTNSDGSTVTSDAVINSIAPLVVPGTGTSTADNSGVAIGYASYASYNATSIGADSSAGRNSVSIGWRTYTNAKSLSTGSVAIGYKAIAGGNSVALGANSDASEDTVSVGNDTLKRRIVNVDTPTADNDAATKAYVDEQIAALKALLTVDSEATAE